MKKIQLKTWFVYVVLLIANTSITADSLPAPIVLEPKDTALIQGTQLRIKWQPLESGQWCQIQVANDPAFIQLLANEDNIYGTEWTYELLPQDGNVYYWRIRARMMEMPLLEGEGESIEGEPPVEGEGEVPVEGEGEMPAEGEGEAPVEGEGELTSEGESFVEGESEAPIENEGEGEDEASIEGEEEGELQVEGDNEGESGVEDNSCGCCNADGKSLKGLLGDWLLIGLALVFLNYAQGSENR